MLPNSFKHFHNPVLKDHMLGPKISSNVNLMVHFSKFHTLALKSTISPFGPGRRWDSALEGHYTIALKGINFTTLEGFRSRIEEKLLVFTNNKKLHYFI